MGMADTDRHQLTPTPVRIPSAIKDELQAQARAAGRSLNAEIVHRLVQTLGEDFAAEQPALALMREQTGYLRELRDMARAQAEQSRQSALTALD